MDDFTVAFGRSGRVVLVEMAVVVGCVFASYGRGESAVLDLLALGFVVHETGQPGGASRLLGVCFIVVRGLGDR